jgi:hypothetical protein
MVRLFRNALQHNFFQLVGRVKKKKDNSKNKEYYFLKEYVESLGHEVKEKVFFKINFVISDDKLIDFITKLGEVKNEDAYFLINIEINIFNYFNSLESALIELEIDIKNKKELTDRFLNNLKMKNWMKVFERE